MSSSSTAESEGRARLIPVRAFPLAGGLEIVEVDVAGMPDDFPFQQDQIEAARGLERPFSSRRVSRTEIEDTTAPDGLIFHSGRCGSTLLAAALSALQGCRVVSEPGAINDVLSEEGFWRTRPWAHREDALRYLMHLLREGASLDRGPFIVKLSSWNARSVARFRDLWPAIPKIYLYREPRAAFASFAARPPIWVRHAKEDGPWEHVARTMADGMRAVIDMIESGGPGRWLLINYAELAPSMPAICEHFTLRPVADLDARFADLAKSDAKMPGRMRMAGTQDDGVEPAVGSVVETLLREPYQRLEQLRAAQDAEPSTPAHLSVSS